MAENRMLFDDDVIRIIFRVDDPGFCHGSNEALKILLDEGSPVTAVSVIANTPWLDEAVDILKDRTQISIGVHACLNCEWMPFRWGPVLPVYDVPSLVNEWGKFFSTRVDFWENNPKLDEIEKEIRAQVELLLGKGLKISYLDHHMGTLVDKPETRRICRKIADDYGLVIPRWFGEKDLPSIYAVPPEKKAQMLVDQVNSIEEPGLYLVVCHPGLDVSEMNALIDQNPTGVKGTGRHRQAETDALLNPLLRQIIKEKNIELIGYDYFKQHHREQMHDPNE